FGLQGDPDIPAISPNGTSVVYRRGGPARNLWIRDLTRGAERRFTTGASTSTAAVWSPDGDSIAFSSTRGGNFVLFRKGAHGSGQEELLLAATGNSDLPSQWSRDGRFLVYEEDDRKTLWDIWVLNMERGADRKPVPFLRSEYNELHGRLSPDSHWMAYTSDESGLRREVYVRPFPPGEDKWQISITGGEQPRWR